MQYACTTPATADPVTLADVLAHSRIDEHADDAYVALLIKKATRAVERELSKQFITATWKLYLDRFPDEIELRVLPVASIISIYYTNTEGTNTLLAATEYQGDCVSPDCPCRIKPAYGKSWPSTRGDTYNAVTITFTAGYGTTAAFVPESIKHILAFIVANWYEKREPVDEDAQNVSTSLVPFALQWLMSKEDWGGYS